MRYYAREDWHNGNNWEAGERTPLHWHSGVTQQWIAEAAERMLEDVARGNRLVIERDDGAIVYQRVRIEEHRCLCGRATGVPCNWVGPLSEMVVVEWMPDYLRASHEAAGSSGCWPHNGAERLAVEESCGRTLCEDDHWVSIVEDDPAKHVEF